VNDGQIEEVETFGEVESWRERGVIDERIAVCRLRYRAGEAKAQAGQVRDLNCCNGDCCDVKAERMGDDKKDLRQER